MMGLKDSVLFMSWFTTYVLIFAVIAALITAITSASVYKYSNKGLIFLWFFFFGVSVFCFCYLISIFFTRARIAATIGAILFLGLFFPYFAVSGNSISTTSKSEFCLCCSSCCWLRGLYLFFKYVCIASIIVQLLLACPPPFVLVWVPQRLPISSLLSRVSQLSMPAPSCTISHILFRLECLLVGILLSFHWLFNSIQFNSIPFKLYLVITALPLIQSAFFCCCSQSISSCTYFWPIIWSAFCLQHMVYNYHGIFFANYRIGAEPAGRVEEELICCSFGCLFKLLWKSLFLKMNLVNFFALWIELNDQSHWRTKARTWNDRSSSGQSQHWACWWRAEISNSNQVCVHNGFFVCFVNPSWQQGRIFIILSLMK